MTKEIQLSICIATHNRSIFLKEAISSFIPQLNDEIERTNDNYDELEYLYLTNDILSDYYDESQYNNYKDFINSGLFN